MGRRPNRTAALVAASLVAVSALLIVSGTDLEGINALDSEMANFTTYQQAILTDSSTSSAVAAPTTKIIITTTATTTNTNSDLSTDRCNQSMNMNYNNASGGITISNSSTNCTAAANHISFVLPWWRQIIWNILFGGMVIVATGGNLIVVWIVVTTNRMRTVTNYFIVNLSIADAMVSSLNVAFSYIYMLDNDWPFGEFFCKASQFVATLTISASVFTLMAISIDRYIAIMKPLKPRMSKRCNLAISATIWTVAAVISYPMLAFFTTGDILTPDGVRTVCYSEWPDGQTNHSQLEYIFNIVFMILTYFLPVISMTITYSRVGIELWGSKAIGEYAPRQVENVKSKRRVVKMMIVVVVIFAVCWLPFHVYFIVTSCYPSITESDYIQEVYLAIYWLAMSNSMYNPIIYCWMNSRFRYGFKKFFRWCPFIYIGGGESFKRPDIMTSRYSCSGSPDHNRIKRIDSQPSMLFSCHSGKAKNRKNAEYGVLRQSTLGTHRGILRHSAPIRANAMNNVKNNNSTYYQRCSLNTDVGGIRGGGDVDFNATHHELGIMGGINHHHQQQQQKSQKINNKFHRKRDNNGRNGQPTIAGQQPSATLMRHLASINNEHDLLGNRMSSAATISETTTTTTASDILASLIT